MKAQVGRWADRESSGQMVAHLRVTHLPAPYLLLLGFEVTGLFLLVLTDHIQIFQVVFEKNQVLLQFLFLLLQQVHLLVQMSLFHQELAVQTAGDTFCIERPCQPPPANPASRISTPKAPGFKEAIS